MTCGSFDSQSLVRFGPGLGGVRPWLKYGIFGDAASGFDDTSTWLCLPG